MCNNCILGNIYDAMVFFESKNNFYWLEITKVSGDASISKVIGGNKLETLVGDFFHVIRDTVKSIIVVLFKYEAMNCNDNYL